MILTADIRRKAFRGSGGAERVVLGPLSLTLQQSEIATKT